MQAIIIDVAVLMREKLWRLQVEAKKGSSKLAASVGQHAVQLAEAFPVAVRDAFQELTPSNFEQRLRYV